MVVSPPLLPGGAGDRLIAVHGFNYARFSVNINAQPKIFLIDARQRPLVVARGQQAPRPLQQLLALLAQGSPLALFKLSSPAPHAAAVADHVLVGVVFHLAPSAGFAATGVVQINSAARSRTS